MFPRFMYPTEVMDRVRIRDRFRIRVRVRLRVRDRFRVKGKNKQTPIFNIELRHY